MPGTHRTPTKALASQVPGPPTPQDDISVVQDIDFHKDVVVMVNANADRAGTRFDTTFRNKNAQVKRTITRLDNLLGPIEFQPMSQLHEDNIKRLRVHLGRIDAAVDALNDFIDEQSVDLEEEHLQLCIRESEVHTPRILDLSARVTVLEERLKKNRRPPTPPPSVKMAAKIDNTFKPRLLDENSTHVAFNKWKKDFTVYMSRNGFENAPPDQLRALVNNCLTPQMENTLSTVCELPDDASLGEIMSTLHKYFMDSINITSQRFGFFNCIQNEGETIRQYMTRFRNIGDFADFDNFTYKDQMAFRLVTGVRDDTLRRELLRLKKLDFDTVSKFALTWEHSNINSGYIRPKSMDLASGAHVDKVSTYRANRKASFQKAPGRHSMVDDSQKKDDKESNRQQSCFNCGGSRHPLSSCPARDQSCSFCKKKGHYAKVCRSAKNGRSKKQHRAQVGHVDKHESSRAPSEDSHGDQDISDTDSPFHVGNLDFEVFEVDSRIQAPTPRIDAIFSVHGKTLGTHHVVPDTGAAVSVLPSSISRSWGLTPDPISSEQTLKNADGTPIKCIGTRVLDIKHNNMQSEVTFFVCHGIRSVILSWLALKNIAIIPPDFPSQIAPHLSLQRVDAEVNSNCLDMLKNQYINQYQSVFNDRFLSEMRGQPMFIHLKKDFQPHNVKTITRPRPVPIPLRDSVHNELMTMVKKGIIRPIDQPTDFVSPMVVVPKRDNRVRIVIDYTQLNQCVRRPSHPFPSMAEVRALIPPSAKFFATLDAVQGYLQIPLHPSSQPLTTFLTPWGRYCFTRAPMGLSCSGDVFCARGDQAFKGIPNIIKVVDDILIFGDDLPSLKASMDAVLEAAKINNITLSKTKFKISTSVDFVGYNITKDAITPDRKHFEALASFPKPGSKTDLRSFLGLVNQFSPFSSKIATLAKPLRPLLCKNTQWHWQQDHQLAFEALRKELVSSNALHCFRPDRQTRLMTDASRLNGLGYALMQLVPEENKWVLIACGSRFITETESNYAVFELEALAIVWAINKCRIFLLGMQSFEVVTDHRPLVSIFNSTRLAKADNPRILRMMQKVSMYSFSVVWTPGKTHCIPDALSRAPLPIRQSISIGSVPTEGAPTEVRIHASMDSAVLDMAKAAAKDSAYQDVVHAIRSMPPQEVRKLPVSTHAHVRILASLWDRLSIDLGTSLVLLDASRIFVPFSFRRNVLNSVHGSHQGITRTNLRMKALYFWPGMANEIIQAVQSCGLCQKFRDEQPAQPIKPHPPPPRPFHSVSIDIFEYKRTFFMTYVDRFSGWPSVAYFQSSPSSLQVISALGSIFKDFGVPVNIRHDGATPFVSRQFRDFLRELHINDQLTSAYNPSSNGHAEASVKSMKALVKKCWLRNSLDKRKFEQSLLEWRNVPRYPGNLSPAELVFARRLRSAAPAISYKAVSYSKILAAVKANHSYAHDKYQSINTFRKQVLPPLVPGDKVRIRNCHNHTWDKSGTIVEARPNGQSYFVDQDGKRILRNRRLLMKKTHN